MGGFEKTAEVDFNVKTKEKRFWKTIQQLKRGREKLEEEPTGFD